jgi:hypothetical protein
VAVVGLVMVLLFNAPWPHRPAATTAAIARAGHGAGPGHSHPSRLVIPPSPPPAARVRRCSLQWRSTLGGLHFPALRRGKQKTFPTLNRCRPARGSPS